MVQTRSQTKRTNEQAATLDQPAPSKNQMPYRIGSIAQDGFMSKATGQGACSHHGGVIKWILSDGSTSDARKNSSSSKSVQTKQPKYEPYKNQHSYYKQQDKQHLNKDKLKNIFFKIFYFSIFTFLIQQISPIYQLLQPILTYFKDIIDILYSVLYAIIVVTFQSIISLLNLILSMLSYLKNKRQQLFQITIEITKIINSILIITFKYSILSIINSVEKVFSNLFALTINTLYYLMSPAVWIIELANFSKIKQIYNIALDLIVGKS